MIQGAPMKNERLLVRHGSLIAADMTLLLIHVLRDDTAEKTDPLLVDFLWFCVLFLLNFLRVQTCLGSRGLVLNNWHYKSVISVTLRNADSCFCCSLISKERWIMRTVDHK